MTGVFRPAPRFTPPTSRPFVFSAAAAAGVTFISSETVQSDVANSSASITVPSDCTCVVFCAAGLCSYELDEPTINSVASTRVVNTTGGGNMNAAIFHLVNPATGSQTFAWDWSNSVTEGSNGELVYLKGVDTTTPVTDSSTANPGADFTGLTTGSTDMTIGVASSFSSTLTVTGDSQTEIATGVYNNADIGCAYKVNSTTWEYSGGAFHTACVVVFAAS